MGLISAETSGHQSGDLPHRYAACGPPTLDELHLKPIPLVPEIELYLAEDAIIFWARLEAEGNTPAPVPFWASAWAGGKALARFLLDNPEFVAGKRVLDIGSGSGLAAIAAALAGGIVTANDTDPDAIAAIALNAKANGVSVALLPGDILRTGVSGYDVVTAGDALYATAIAADMLTFMRRQASKGVTVLLGDPDRGHLPHDDLRLLRTYPMVDSAFADAHIEHASVFRLSPDNGRFG